MKKKIILIFCFINISFSIFAETNQKNSTSLISEVESWYENNMNYASIALLMAAESSILPVPSELVIPPAAYIAFKPESSLNIFWVVLFGTIGALVGATINYFLLGMLLGRAVLYRFADSKIGHLLFLSSEKLQRAENYFNTHGKISTFVGRFIPVVRHLISIPAGFAKMNFATFALFTFIGAGLWNCCLALLGYVAHGQADMIDKYAHEISIGIVIMAILVVILLIIRYFLKKKKEIIKN
jgi:membrane protein DedA with SNARE-associated domain